MLHNSAYHRLLLLLLLLAGGLLAQAGCQPFQATAPKGFAPLDIEPQFEAVTPEGVMYRVRREENKPRATLQFWRKALKQRMKDAGYVFVAEQDVKAAGVPGYLIELAAPFGNKDYAYLVAVFVRDKHLTIVEAAGELKQVRPRRAALVKAIASIRW